MFMRRPDQGSLSAIWAGVAPEAREGQFENGTYCSDPDEKGKETLKDLIRRWAEIAPFDVKTNLRTWLVDQQLLQSQWKSL